MDRARWVQEESAHNTSNVLKNLLVNLDLSGHRVNGIDSRGLLLCRCYLCIKKTKFICLSLMWFRNRIEFDRDEGRRVSFVLQNELIYLLWNSSNPITSVYFIYIINAVGKYEDTKATSQLLIIVFLEQFSNALLQIRYFWTIIVFDLTVI